MIFPYNTYLKYLLMLGTSPSTVINNLQNLGYVPPSEEYLRWFVTGPMGIISEALKLIEKEKDPKKGLENLAKKLGVESMHKYKSGKLIEESLKKELDEAFVIVGDGHIRDMVEALLLRNFESPIISQLLNTSDIVKITPEGIDAYRLYFWDVKNVDRLDWKEYLDKIPDKRDKFMRIMSMYGNPEYVKWKLGLKPKVEYSDMVEDMMTHLYFRFTELIKSDNPDTAMKAAKIAESTMKLGDRLQEIKKDTSAGFIGELQQNLNFIEQDIPSLMDLQGEVKK